MVCGYGVVFGAWLCVLGRAKTQTQANNWTILDLWHIGYRQKALVIARRNNAL